jgi:trans-aconitate methyltransferase
VLPFPPDTAPIALELGIGSGFLAGKFFEKFPRGRLIGLDGSESMLELASSRLHGHGDRLQLIQGGFEPAALTQIPPGSIDLVLSSYSLHHLGPSSKLRLLAAAAQKMVTGGWMFNADLCSCPFPTTAATIRNILVRGIFDRNDGSDPRFPDLESIDRYISDLETNENDQPLTVEEDLDLLRRAGIADAFLFWKEHIEAVCGGRKTP